MSAEWKKFNNTSSQMMEINAARHGYKYKWKSGKETVILNIGIDPSYGNLIDIDYYLICEPLPHAEMRAEHAMTGRAVEYFHRTNKIWTPTSGDPCWNDFNEYRFKKPEKNNVFCRRYVLLDNILNTESIAMHDKRHNTKELESCGSFIKWIDYEWQEVEL